VQERNRAAENQEDPTEQIGARRQGALAPVTMSKPMLELDKNNRIRRKRGFTRIRTIQCASALDSGHWKVCIANPI
jgi:hypothetical protein